MTKQDKYIDYIIDGLLKDSELVKFRNGLYLYGVPFIDIELISLNDIESLTVNTKLSRSFEIYLTSKYGVPKGIVYKIWGLYRDKLINPTGVVKTRNSPYLVYPWTNIYPLIV